MGVINISFRIMEEGRIPSASGTQRASTVLVFFLRQQVDTQYLLYFFFFLCLKYKFLKKNATHIKKTIYVLILLFNVSQIASGLSVN